MNNMQNFDGSTVKLDFNQLPELVNDDSVVFATDAKTFSLLVNSFSIFKYGSSVSKRIKNIVNVKGCSSNSNITIFATNSHVLASRTLPAYVRSDFSLRFTDAKNIALLLKTTIAGLKKDENPLFILKKPCDNLFSIEIGNAYLNYNLIENELIYDTKTMVNGKNFEERGATLAVNELEQMIAIAKKTGNDRISFYKQTSNRAVVGFEMQDSNKRNGATVSGAIAPCCCID